MSQNKELLLSPLSWVYGAGVSVRNFLYEKEFLKSVSFDIPTIGVGNLSVGGTGKTPHIEYLIRLLRPYIKVATLSRGYKRKTQGFREVQQNSTALEVGDEPLQFKRKYPDITVTVSEDRTFGVPQILMRDKTVQTVLLDDVYQHRAIKAGLNILLTEYEHPFTHDFLLPAGRLREWRTGYKRADVIIITKCPADLKEKERQQFIKEINPLPHQEVYFSTFNYKQPYYPFNPSFRYDIQKEWEVLLVSGIAKPEYLIDHLVDTVSSLNTLEFRDHHHFEKHDISKIHQAFNKLDPKKAVIITTEKDMTRLEPHAQFFIKNRIPILCLPIEVDFLFEQKKQFDDMIIQFLMDFKV